MSLGRLQVSRSAYTGLATGTVIAP